MTSLTCMRGYSGSGKSTVARKMADFSGAVIVCRDDMRNMLHGTYWSGKAALEEQVTIAEDAQVIALLKAGHDVIVDATHLHAPFLRKWARVASRHGATFTVHDVRTDPETCVQRDWRRDRSVGEDVIRRQVARYPMGKWPVVVAEPPFEPIPAPPRNDNLSDALIVDIDGTLAHMTGRSPYDYSRVSEDSVDECIASLVNTLHPHADILIVSGRDHTCREDTLEWLEANGILYDELFMRPAGAKDSRGNKIPDYIVKHNLYNEHIRGKYNVVAVFDDRDQVVDLWRAMGLKCLQVERGDF